MYLKSSRYGARYLKSSRYLAVYGARLTENNVELQVYFCGQMRTESLYKAHEISCTKISNSSSPVHGF